MRLQRRGRLPLRPERDRRHGPDALPGGARPRGSRRRRGGRRRACARVAPGDHVALSWAPSCGRVLRVPARAAAPVRRRPGRRWARAGCSTAPRGSRATASAIYHYSFISSFAEACVVPERSCVPIPTRRAVRRSPASSAAPSRRASAPSGTRPSVRPGDRVAVFGCGGVGLSAVLGAVAAGAGADRRGRRAARRSSRRRASSARPTACCGRARPRRPPRRCARRRGGGVDYAIEATGRTEAMLAAFLSTRAAGRRGADRDPARGRRAAAAGALDPAHGAPRARLDLRLDRDPERDFPLILDLYRRGRLPLDRLISHRLPLDEDRARRSTLLRVAARRSALSSTWERPCVSLDDSTGDRRGLGRPSPNGSHVNVVLARAAAPPRRRRSACSPIPRPGTRRCWSAWASASRLRAVWPPTLMMNKATALDDRTRRSPGAPRSSASAGRARRVADGLIEATRAARAGRVWVDPRRDETAVRRAARRRARRSTMRERRDPTPAALVDGATRCEPVLRRRLRAHRRGRDAPLPCRSTRRSTRPGIRCRDAAGGDDRDRAHRRGRRGLRERRRAARPRAARAPAGRASTRCAPRSCARSARRSTSTAAGPGRSRSRSGTWSARALGVPLWQLLGGRSERLSPTPRAASCVDAAERVRALRRARATRACAPSSSASTTPTGATTSPSSRRCATRSAPTLEIMVDANQGWRMPGDLAPRWDVATAAQCARALERLGVYWLEEPLRTDDPDGYAALRRLTDLRIAAGEMVRTAAEARDLVVRGGVDVLQCDVVPLPAASRAAAASPRSPSCTGGAWSPHTWSNGFGLVANLHLALAVSRLPLRRGAVRPARPARRRGATGCCRRRSRSPPTGRSRRRRGRRASRGRPGLSRRARGAGGSPSASGLRARRLRREVRPAPANRGGQRRVDGAPARRGGVDGR